MAALGALGLDAAALEPAEDAGLLRLVDGRLAFRHPLVRSAVYHAATPSDRRAAHRALADALAGSPHAEARAWHLAGAALGPDEEAAARARAGGRARPPRGGYAAAAAALERAARLSPDSSRRRRAAGRRRRRGLAGGAHRDARRSWSPRRSRAPPRIALRAAALRLRGAIEYFGGRARRRRTRSSRPSRCSSASDPGAAVAAAADAVERAASACGRPGPRRSRPRAGRGRSRPPDGGEPDAEAPSRSATRSASPAATARPRRTCAARLDAAQRGPRRCRARSRSGRLSAALGWLGRHEQAHAYLAEAVARARAAGAVGRAAAPARQRRLAGAPREPLERGVGRRRRGGRAGGAARPADHGHAGARRARVARTRCAATRRECRELRGRGDRAARRGVGFRLYGLLASHCARRCSTSARAGWTRRSAGSSSSRGTRTSAGSTFPASRRSSSSPRRYVARRPGRGRARRSSSAFERSEPAAAPLPAALAERCRGLLAREDGFDARLRRGARPARARREPVRPRPDAALLRRAAAPRGAARRRARAAAAPRSRRSSGSAPQPWAERARAELRASGETLRRREPTRGASELTPQELQIALQVAEGKANKEVGAALFLSHKTVEFHLSRIYRKLDIHSRAELIRRFAAEGAGSAAAGPG